MANTTRQRGPETPEEMKNWIKRTYWDYLCAYRLFSNSLKNVDTIFSTKLPQSLSKLLPNFDDFQCSYEPLNPVDILDKNVGHVSSPASNADQAFMRGIGFKTVQYTPILGAGEKSGHDFGVAFPDDKPINGRPIYFDPFFSCRYVGKEPVTIHDLEKNNVLWGLKSLALLRDIVPATELSQATQLTAKECFFATLHEDWFHTLTQYADFTLCPLIWRIKRYYKEVLGSRIFSKNTAPETLSPEEKDLREVCQLRDVFFAHNMHYPPKPGNPLPKPFTYAYDAKGKGIWIKKILYSIDRDILQERMENAVMNILNKDAPEEEKFHTAQELEADLARRFPDLSQKMNGAEPAFVRLVRYIAQNTNFEYTTKFGYGILDARNMPTLLELAGAPNPQAISADRAFRVLALHDHFPFEEFYGDGAMSRIHISSKKGKPKNFGKAEQVKKANTSLIEAALNGQKEDLHQQTLDAAQRRRQGGR